MNTVMSLDLVTKRYTALAPMIVPRRDHETAAVDGKLFAIGGRNNVPDGFGEEERLSSVECLDLSVPNSEWTPMAPMTMPLCDLGVGVTGGKIYVIGGESDDGKSVECFDPHDGPQGRWTLIHMTLGFVHGSTSTAC